MSESNQEYTIFKNSDRPIDSANATKVLLVLTSDHPTRIDLCNKLAHCNFQLVMSPDLMEWQQLVNTTSQIHGYLVDLALSHEESFFPSVEHALSASPAPLFYLIYDYNRSYDKGLHDSLHHGIVYASTPIEILSASITRTIEQYKSRRNLEEQSAKLQQTFDQLNLSKDQLMQMQRQNKWWEQLMDYVIWNSPTPIAIFNNNLQFIFVSKKFLVDYGVEQDQVIGKHHYQVFTQVPEKWKHIHARVLEGETLGNQEDFYYKEDGTKEYTSWECRPWYQADGTVGGIVLYSAVITKQKNQEEKLKAQLEEKRIILAETQHRIKNNFASIEALLSLHSQQDIHPEAREALQEAGSRVSSLRILYERLLHSAEMRTVEMNRYLEDLAKTLCSTINPTILPHLELSCDPMILGPNQAFPVGAIMVELMTNSLKYGFPMDQTTHDDNPPTLGVEFGILEPGTIVLKVKDNGIGFEPEKLEHHSNSFGLTLIRLMTEQLNGKLVTSSSPGQGTTTTISFPC